MVLVLVDVSLQCGDMVILGDWNNSGAIGGDSDGQRGGNSKFMSWWTQNSLSLSLSLSPSMIFVTWASNCNFPAFIGQFVQELEILIVICGSYILSFLLNIAF